jgi:allophanate hydrolase subunit 2
MDPSLLSRGNEAVGNAGGAAALEITLTGPELEVLAGGTAAIAGSIDAEKNGTPLSAGRPFALAPGDRVRLARVTAGVRAYLCVAGGFAVPPLQWQTRRLSAQDILFRDEARAAPRVGASAAEVSADGVVRVVIGPQEDRFGSRGIADFLSRPWRVSASSDRRGVRLEGEPLHHEGSAEIEPEGTALGAIQVPADGQPIVLGPDRPVTGGYAKIGTVVTADWPLVAQAGPAALLCFRAV